MFRVTLKRAAVVAAVLALVLPGTANADPVGASNGLVAASGTVDVHNDRTTWNLNLTSLVNSANGYCVFVQITVDRNNWTDPDLQSTRLCRTGQTALWADSKSYSGTRGAKISLCRQERLRPDRCQQVQYVPER